MAASVDLGSVYATMKLQTEGFSKGITDTQNELNNLAGSTQRSATVMGSALDNVAKVGFAALAAAAVAATALIATNIGAAVKRVDTLNNSARTFENMGIKSADAEEAVAKLTKSILGLPTPLDVAVKGMTDLTATYGDVKLGQEVFSSLNNAILGFGGTTDSVRNAITQLSQLPLDGPLDGQTWLSLRNSGLTPVLVAMSKDMGISIGEMRKRFGEGTLTVQDFTDRLIYMNKNGGGGMKSLEKIAQDSTKGIGTSIENMKTAVTRGIANIIKAVGTEDIAKAITAIGTAFESALKGSVSFIEFLKNNKDVFAPIVIGITAFVAVITTLFTWFRYIKPAILGFNAVLSANPVVLITAAIIALVAGLAYFFTQTETGKRAVEGLSKAFKGLWDFLQPVRDFIKDQLVSAFDSLKSIWAQIVTAMQPLLDIFQEFWQKHGEKVMQVLKVIGIALAAVVIAPLVAGFLLFVGALKVLAVVLRFVADHFEVIKKVVITVLAVAFAPLIIAIGLVVLAVKLVVAIVRGMIDAFNFTKKAVKEAGEAISRAWDSAVEGVKKAVTAISNTVTSVFTAVKDFIVGVWQSVYNAVIGPLTAMGNFIMAVLDFIKNLFIIVFGSILLVILTVVGFIKDSLINGFLVIYNFLLPIVTTIWNFLVTAFNTVKDAIVGAVTAIWDGIVAVWNAIVAFITPIVQGIIDFFIQRWENLKANTMLVFNALKDFFVNVWNAIKDAITGVVQRIIDFFAPALSWLLEKGKDIVRGLINGIKSLASGAWNAIKEVADKIGQAFSGAASWLYNIGKDIVQGLINGIKDMVGKVGEAAGNIGGAVKGKLKSVLGIGSPSKVMRQYGVWTGQGFIEGVNKMQSQIANTMDVAFTPSAVDISGLTPKNVALQGTVSTPSSTDNSRSVIINGDISISNQQDADYLLQRLSLKQDLTTQGLVGA